MLYFPLHQAPIPTYRPSPLLILPLSEVITDIISLHNLFLLTGQYDAVWLRW